MGWGGPQGQYGHGKLVQLQDTANARSKQILNFALERKTFSRIVVQKCRIKDRKIWKMKKPNTLIPVEGPKGLPKTPSIVAS